MWKLVLTAASFGLCFFLGSVVIAWLRDTPTVLPAQRQPRQAVAREWQLPSLPPREQALLSGVVRDEQGKSIPGALVCARCWECSVAQTINRCTETNDQGAFVLPPPAARAVKLVASAGGYAPGAARAGSPISISGAPQTGLDIVLKAGGAKVSGQVVDVLGGPVAHARVQLTSFEHEVESSFEAVADADGRFVFFAASARARLKASAAGYGAATVFRMAPAADVEIALTPQSVIEGRVRSAATGEPIADVEVTAHVLGSVTVPPSARSEDDGSFTLSGLEPGSYVLTAQSAHYRSLAPLPLELGLMEVRQDVELPLGRGAHLLGHVQIEPENKPCERGYVALSASHAGSDPAAGQAGWTAPIEADGTVRLMGVPRGRYEVSVGRTGHVASAEAVHVEVSDSDLEQTWKVRVASGLRIRVVDSHGEPVAHAELFLRYPAVASAERYCPLEADQEGLIELGSELSAGRYTIEAKQGIHADPMTIDLDGRSGVREVEYRFTHGGFVWLTLDGETGADRGSLMVTARPLDETKGDALFADRSAVASNLGGGRYRVGPLAAGSYAVEIEDGINAPIIATANGSPRIVIVGGADVDARASLRVQAAVRGKVVDDRGEPVANAWISGERDSRAPLRVSSGGNPLLSKPRVLSDEDGTFELTGLSDDTQITLRVQQTHARIATVRNVRANQYLSLVLPRASSLAGSVQTDETETGQISVHASHLDTGKTASVTAAPDGSFRFDELPAGLTAITATGAGLRSSHQEIELVAGQRREALRISLSAAQEDRPVGGATHSDKQTGDIL